MAKKHDTPDQGLPAHKRKPIVPRKLIADLRELIGATRTELARTVNSAQVLLNWQIGHRLRVDVLGTKRAGYGEQIIRTVAEGLTADYGRGFSEKSLRHMIRLVERFPDREIVSALSRQLDWTHFRALIYIEDPLKREFYAEMCRVERWSTRTLEKKIGGMLFERTALSRRPERLARQELAALRDEDRVSPDLVFRDPYLLDFLGLKDTYGERDLESAILRDLEAFILELGAGFTFVARQKRITVDNQDYYLDLLFYHRKLRRMVAVELKMGAFQAADKGQIQVPVRHDLQLQMEHYLRAAGLEGRSDKTPLFRTARKKKKKRELTDRGLNGNDLLRIVKRRLKGAGLPEGGFCCHSFRATTATNLLKQKVSRDQVQYLLGHSDARTTDLYNRTDKEVTRNVVERISL
jgi:predicted nuclease of restriction endonuclease-like (RecB) superfamily